MCGSQWIDEMVRDHFHVSEEETDVEECVDQ
jgi:hypothetical protein